MQNLYIHDWHLADSVTTDDAHGGVIGNYPYCRPTGTRITHSIISNTEARDAGRQNGVAVRSTDIEHSVIHDVQTAQLFGLVNNSEFYNVSYPATGRGVVGSNQGFDPTPYHENNTYVEGWDGIGLPAVRPALIYNNVFHDIQAGSGAIYPNGCPATPFYIFNNVVYNNFGNQAVQIDQYGGSGTCGEYHIWNNTFQVPSSLPTGPSRQVGRGIRIQILDTRNNHYIHNRGSQVALDPGAATWTKNNNVSQSNFTAHAQGYKLSNRYAPANASGATVGTGAALSSHCSGWLSALCKDLLGRDRTGTWDVGAYESVAVSDAAPPTVSITAPAGGATISETVTVTATAADNVGVVSLQFKLDGANLGAQKPTAPFSILWDTNTASNGTHTLTAIARDAAGNQAISGDAVVTVNNLPPVANYSIPSNGAQVFNATAGTGGQLAVGSVTIQPAGGTDAPGGFTVIGLRQGGVLVAEAGIPASTPILSGRIFAQIDDTTKTGVAFTNPGTAPAAITYYFTNSDGVNSNQGAFTLESGREFAAFLDQAPFNGIRGMEGSFTFVSTLPLAAIGIRGYVNERNEFLFTTLPVLPMNGGSSLRFQINESFENLTALTQQPAVIPLYSTGGGWTTEIVLINPTDSALSGMVQFVTPGGSPAPTLVGSVLKTDFPYVIARRGTVRLVAADSDDRIQTGSVRVNPTAASVSPYVTAIFSYKNRGVTVSQASVSASARSAQYRLYLEKSGIVGAVGSTRSGVAIANTFQIPITVQLELVRLDGRRVGNSALRAIPSSGQLSRFIDELFPDVPTAFRGTVRVTATSVTAAPIVVTGIRGRYNERHDFLLTSTPLVDETAAPSSLPLVFTHVVSGAGYTTQLILLTDSPGAASGRMSYRSQDGALLPEGTLQQQP